MSAVLNKLAGEYKHGFVECFHMIEINRFMS